MLGFAVDVSDFRGTELEFCGEFVCGDAGFKVRVCGARVGMGSVQSLK